MSEIRPRKDKDFFVKDVPNPICYVTQKIREKSTLTWKKKQELIGVRELKENLEIVFPKTPPQPVPI